MALVDLSGEEKTVVYDCLRCVASGKVILHDWEFETIMGLEVSEFLAVVVQWPDVDDSDTVVYLAINNAMNNLLGYPHGKELSRYMDASRPEIARIFTKWRGRQVQSYFNGMA